MKSALNLNAESAATTAHIPVMLKQTLEYLDVRGGGTYADCTAGGGGHLAAIVAGAEQVGRIVAIDWDSAATKKLAERFDSIQNLSIHCGNYAEIGSIMKETGIEKFDGVLLDLGISSDQLGDAGRGFSFGMSGPLDMRISPAIHLTAADVVNTMGEEELAGILREFGEERFASSIAFRIVKQRRIRKIATTSELREIAASAYPRHREPSGIDPATRTFQAIRIHINNELGNLERFLTRLPEILKIGGRAVIISFHSLEDRLVKNWFREHALDCVCPSKFPVCVCDKTATMRVLTNKPVRPSPGETRDNPRARSAKLRAAERIKEEKRR
jgi:16S rRNA (cytosine1402-N4)-methyltransferase